MRLGVDFDNTIAGYDRVFGRLAVECGYLDAVPAGGKRAVRDRLRQRSDGDLDWQRLQALAYGPHMAEAEMFDGVDAFFRRCRADGIDVYIVSHKTRFASLDDGNVDLREAALAWMDAHRFFDIDGLGLRETQIFFEDCRAGKIARIGGLGCTHFIDDLREVFADPGFPAEVARVLFDPHAQSAESGLTRFSNWNEITDHVLGSVH